mgnify:FL=1
MDVAQSLVGDVSVDLRGDDIFVAEKLLNTAERDFSRGE